MKKQEVFKKLGLYVHIPFCIHKCAYCDFYSTDRFGQDGEHPQIKAYCKALRYHLRMVGEKVTDYDVDSVYIGGGTPTALSSALLCSIVKEIKNDYYEADALEWTVECNPATSDYASLRRLRRCGVNRLSIGLQSANAQELTALGRIHTKEEFEETFFQARDAGFENINVDVMFGIPHQTQDSLLETLSYIVSLEPEHISLYNLILEDGTPLFKKRESLVLPDENEEFAMYQAAIRFLAENGYAQYEISNFAKEGYRCRHNLRYWQGEEYLGFGPAAHSYYAGHRFAIAKDTEQYIQIMRGKPKQLPADLLSENERIHRRDELIEYIMLRLRLCEGIDCADFAARFSGDFEAIFGKKCAVYVKHGFMQHQGNRYALTPKGMFVSNTIISSLFPDSVLEKSLKKGPRY